jgi:UDP-N-acetylmuramoyl-L-alanyl-D-glutamate--2,6-diaminopimelate ligase
LGWLGVEISPEGLMSGLYKDIPFNLTVLTNLFPRQGGTLPQHKYLAAHRKLLAASQESGITLLNADDPLSLDSADTAGGRVITYALHYPKAMVTAENYKPLPLGSTFDVSINGDLPRLGSRHNDIRSFPVRVTLPGEVGVYTALAAVTAALALGVPEESIVRSLKTFPGLKRRLEFLHHHDIRIIDDTAPSSKAVKALFGSLTALRFQRIFIILGIEKGEKDALAEIAAELLVQEGKASPGRNLPHHLRGIPVCSQKFITLGRAGFPAYLAGRQRAGPRCHFSQPGPGAAGSGPFL